ncbi:hypothetical protein NIES2135_20370 [Leptolyngbya boryana NIES-2135]|jgi:hypothetical protein|uniref:Uncharacterized protein n=1 Tax=Leptolyngbya boryana NIES-2135 TaxID=1973484 RepID=A0A1Z4JEK9_LEPBY|nr:MULTISPECIES: hypothetical protein [Leptolyngbya]BAY55214.1 hypothetical protein NIES2135_20370 [Leptolyngbya boryana NIES-2135]MBD2369301.1 hypothetical protein [Leptolyngbya sp. FACHB-161]MBD2375697.1 hypothetical protein [Leptolyngbya sp. FACHB-238]MBD2401046.1 hypothetical protein [Leptolyngbya sp. FACHB-239]MBD2406631.1 hypothetical protein [Leptolyngbya sp. FACHB-402]
MSNDRPTPNPGSNEALNLGCRCPVLDNSHGKGYFMQPGLFVFNSDCPLHGQLLPAEEKTNADD